MHDPQILPLVVGENVAIGYPGLTLFTVEKLSLHSGQIVPLIGKNGCGKSTFLKTGAGFLPPIAHNFQYKPGLQMFYLPEYAPLFPQLTVFEHFKLVSSISSSTFAIETLMERCNLSSYKHCPVQYLSAGFKKLLALACLLIRQPHVVWLDEPSSELDEAHTNLLHQLLQEYARRGMTTIFSTHHAHEINLYSTILIVENARLSLNFRNESQVA